MQQGEGDEETREGCDMEEELRLAIQDIGGNLALVCAALAADPEEAELLEVREQLEEALRTSQAALEALAAAAGGTGGTGGEREEEEAGPSALRDAAAAPPPPPAAAAAQGGRPRAAEPGGRSNAGIHPRSRYAHLEPDFAALAAGRPALAQYLVPPRGTGGRPGLDFSSPAACRELTAALLAADFGVDWWVPLGQLVPPVTNRANYLHWLEDLLDLSPPPGTGPAAGGDIVGLDIGCGANLIYPLLGAALCGWRFVGADVTPVALQWARRNREANPRLAPLIEVRAVAMQPGQAAALAAAEEDEGAGAAAEKATAAQAAAAAEEAATSREPEQQQQQQQQQQAGQEAQPQGTGIVSGALRPGERFAFCMCNPPFFESLSEAGANPATAYGGTPAEMVYPGGEAAFVAALVSDSLTLRGRVHWYTTMVGKKASLRAARAALHRHGVRVMRTTEFCQGKTSRWGIAWSFTADPATASQPLRRFGAAGGRGGSGAQAGAGPGPGGPAPQQAQRLSRSVSFSVRAPPAAALEVLEAARAGLCEGQAGLACRVDAAAYTIRASKEPSRRGFQEGGGGGPGEEPPAAKRAKPAGPPPAAAPAAAAASALPALVEVRLHQLSAGLFSVSAALDKSSPAAALPWFGGAVAAVRAAVAARWKLT